MNKNKLFFDFECTGHHAEYISHLVNYLTSNKMDGNYIFVVHPDFPKQFPTIYSKATFANNMQITCMNKDEYKFANQGNLIKRSFRAFKIMDKYAMLYAVQIVFLLHFNIFQFSLGFFRTEYKISGILFLQFYRMKKINIKEKIKYYRKYFQTWFFTLNRQIENIFILNDIKTVDYLNKEFNTNIFRMLPDPISLLPVLPGFSVRKEHQINEDSKIFLHVGILGERKGTFEILDSILLLDEIELTQFAFLFVGKADTNTDKKIIEKISTIKHSHQNIQIAYRNEFITEQMLKSYFAQCDFVLMPYKNPEASSGILGHAIAEKKPVISVSSGLLKEIIVKNELGLLIKKVEPYAIIQAIREIIKYEINPHAANEFVQKHNPKNYASIILNSLILNSK